MRASGRPVGNGELALGAFYTPVALAGRVVARALPGSGAPRVLDPACGDGALLLAAARLLLARGLAPAIIAAGLVGIDRSGAALAAARERLRGLLGEAAAAATLVEGDALLDDGAISRAGPPFDAVVANPPFLSTKRPHLDAATRVALRSRFRLASGQFDAHGIFLERILPLLAPGGRWAFVLPRPVLGNAQLLPLRRLLLEEAGLDTILDAGAPFAAGVEAVVLAGGRGPSTSPLACEGPGGELLPSLSPAALLEDPSLVLPLGATASELSLRTTAARLCPPLSLLFTVERGVELGKRSGAVGPLVPGAAPLRTGEELTEFRLAPPTRALTGTFPASVAKDPRLYLGPKLLVRRVAGGPIAAVDDSDALVLNTLYVLHQREGGAERLHAAAAVLNSRPLRRLWELCFVAGDRIFPYLRAAQLRALPLPLGGPREPELAALGLRLQAGADPPATARVEALVTALLAGDGAGAQPGKRKAGARR